MGMKQMPKDTASHAAAHHLGVPRVAYPATVARQELVQQVKLGISASDARRRCPVPMHRTTVYRLLKRVQIEGESALVDGRHGHPVKLRGEVLMFVTNHCQNHPSVSSSTVQRLVAERFNLSVSVSQLNRIRAAHGLSRQGPPREKKAQNGHYHHARIP